MLRNKVDRTSIKVLIRQQGLSNKAGRVSNQMLSKMVLKKNNLSSQFLYQKAQIPQNLVFSHTVMLLNQIENNRSINAANQCYHNSRAHPKTSTKKNQDKIFHCFLNNRKIENQLSIALGCKKRVVLHLRVQRITEMRNSSKIILQAIQKKILIIGGQDKTSILGISQKESI